MIVPFRLAVLIALTNVLKTVQFTAPIGMPAEETDFSLEDISPQEPRVFRGRVLFGDNDPLPMISILETPLQPDPNVEPAGGSAAMNTWQLVIQGFIPDQPVNPTDPAHFFMAAVKAELARQRRRMAGPTDDYILGIKEIDDLTWNEGVVRPPDETSAVAYFWVTVYVKLVEEMMNPYVEI